MDRLIIGTAAPGGCEPGAKLCGNGLIDAGEQCDDGNSSSGDCCDEDCQYEPAASTCTDNNACTDGDECDGAGSCAGPIAVGCDDGNVCSADSCDPMIGCVNDAAPATGCLTASKGLVLIKNSSDPSKDKLIWKWGSGAALTQTDLADPTSSNGYTLCLYAGGANTLIAGAALPPETGGARSARRATSSRARAPMVSPRRCSRPARPESRRRRQRGRERLCPT